VLRRVFGEKPGEMVGSWRKLRNEAIHKFPSSPNIIRIIKINRACSMGEKGNTDSSLMGKSE
jgi:hypothetical protein